MAKNKKTQNNTLDMIGNIRIIEGDSSSNEDVDELKREIERLQRQIDSGDNIGNEDYIAEIKRLKSELALVEDAIIRIDEKRWKFGRFELTMTRLDSPSDLTDDEFNALGFALAKIGGSVNFWIGDWANLYIDAEQRHKREKLNDPEVNLSDEERSQIYQTLTDKFGLESPRTLQQYASVCRKLPASVRTEATHWSNHELIAFLPEQLKGKEAYYLQVTVERNLTKRKLKELITNDLNKLKAIEVEDPPNYLFNKSRKPKINSLEKLWSKARNDDEKAKTMLIGSLSEIRKWLDEIENSLDE